MGSSDFPPETLDRIKKIQKTGGAATIEERDELRDIILQYDNKYPHTHSRVMFNYGSFLQTIFDHKLTPDQKIDIQESLSQLNAEAIDPLSALVEINKKFEIQKNSGVIVKDDLENHALLNQINSYSQHIAALPAILLDEARHPTIKEAFNAPSGQYITRRSNVPDINQAALSNFKDNLAAKGLKMYLGLEKESAAKDVEIRVSAINDKVGVAEIRLVGNNPHFAKFDSSEITFQPGIDYIPEHLIPAINERIGNYVSGFAVEELRSLHDAKIPVAYNGRIAGLEPVPVAEIARSNPYDREGQDRYDAVTELRKSKIPPSSISPESGSVAKSIVDFSRG